MKGGYSGRYAAPPGRTNLRLYGDENPLAEPAFETKVRLLEQIDAHARAKDPRVRQVSVSFAGTWQVVEILRSDGEIYRDVRPLCASRLDRRRRRQPPGVRLVRLWRPGGFCPFLGNCDWQPPSMTPCARR